LIGRLIILKRFRSALVHTPKITTRKLRSRFEEFTLRSGLERADGASVDKAGPATNDARRFRLRSFALHLDSRASVPVHAIFDAEPVSLEALQIGVPARQVGSRL
jgi:hypothetical protein